eukprot:359841-Chlamydomonas_euryale.AAC.4
MLECRHRPLHGSTLSCNQDKAEPEGEVRAVNAWACGCNCAVAWVQERNRETEKNGRRCGFERIGGGEKNRMF